MSAEAIGRVMRDFRRGRVEVRERRMADYVALVASAEVVDVTAVDQAWRIETKRWDLYGESVCRPPLMNAAYAWVNRHGNVIVVHAVTVQRDEGKFDDLQWESMADTYEIDWDTVEWVSAAWVWLGGWSSTRQQHLPTFGPIGMVGLAISSDGTLQDVRWIDMSRASLPDGEAVLLDYTAVVTRAITFLNMRNVVVLEPARSRAERKRVERTGTTVNEIHITPIGQTHKGKPRQPPIPLAASGPLSSVRGHVARYGPRWGRGLLFGKLEGEFWIPQHHRGSAEAGEILHEYDVEGAST